MTSSGGTSDDSEPGDEEWEAESTNFGSDSSTTRFEGRIKTYGDGGVAFFKGSDCSSIFIRRHSLISPGGRSFGRGLL